MVIRKLASLRLEMTDIVLEFMNLIIDGLTINYHELIERRGGESFDYIIIEATFLLQCIPQFVSTLILIIYVIQIVRERTKNSMITMIVYLLKF